MKDWLDKETNDKAEFDLDEDEKVPIKFFVDSMCG